LTRTIALSALAAAMLAPPASAEELTVDIYEVFNEAVGEQIGTIRLADGDSGLVIEAHLEGLSAGPHGFHLHQNDSCEPAPNKDGQPTAALAAGGHYDPQSTGKHLGPGGGGHKGDLPVLMVLPDEAQGSAPFQRVMVAPQLTLADARGRALVIHAAGDNFRDEPKPLGGGGARVACGVVP
jgi:Cu-Zn family superoxide dismutase